MSRDLMHGAEIKALVRHAYSNLAPEHGRGSEVSAGERSWSARSVVIDRWRRTRIWSKRLPTRCRCSWPVVFVGDRPSIGRTPGRPAALGGPIEISRWRPRW
jgi:hypothetical protein